MTGDYRSPASSRGVERPWIIKYVYLFKISELVKDLEARGVKIGIATSVRKELWERAEIYPKQRNKKLILTEEQRRLLALYYSIKKRFVPVGGQYLRE